MSHEASFSLLPVIGYLDKGTATVIYWEFNKQNPSIDRNPELSFQISPPRAACQLLLSIIHFKLQVLNCWKIISAAWNLYCAEHSYLKYTTVTEKAEMCIYSNCSWYLGICIHISTATDTSGDLAGPSNSLSFPLPCLFFRQEPLQHSSLDQERRGIFTSPWSIKGAIYFHWIWFVLYIVMYHLECKQEG